MTKKRFLLALALMLTAVGGAWAQGNTTPVNPTTTPNQWSLTTPAGNVTLSVDYYGQYTLDSVPTAEGWQVKVNGSLATVTPYTPGSALGHVDNINETDSVELIPPAELKDIIKSVTLVEAAAVEGHALADAVVGEIVGTDGQAYAVADKDNLPEGVTAAGMVAYKSGSNGLVIALTDEASTMDWETANGASGAAAHTPAVTGQAWKLPSQADWQQMFSANGGNEGSSTGLNTALTNAGGTTLNITYWSSTETGYANANYGWFSGGGAGFYEVGKANPNSVRACLAF